MATLNTVIHPGPQDWGRLAQWLAARGHCVDTENIIQFSGGLANLNYKIYIDDLPVVLRRPPDGLVGEGANDMAREWRVLSQIFSAYPLAPRGLHYCEDESVLGKPFQIIEFRDGSAIHDTLPPDWCISDGRALWQDLLDAMGSLHALEPGRVGLETLGKPKGFNERQVAGWLRRASHVWRDDVPLAICELGRYLLSKTPTPSSTSLLHMDLKPDNMLVSTTTKKPVAIIDWDMCTRGDPLMDLGVLLSYWIEPADPEPVDQLQQTPSLVQGIGARDELVEYYAEATGRSVDQVAWYCAVARLRLSVIWQQLYNQWQQGSLRGDYYAQCKELSNEIPGWALQKLMRNEI